MRDPPEISRGLISLRFPGVVLAVAVTIPNGIEEYIRPISNGPNPVVKNTVFRT